MKASGDVLVVLVGLGLVFAALTAAGIIGLVLYVIGHYINKAATRRLKREQAKALRYPYARATRGQAEAAAQEIMTHSRVCAHCTNVRLSNAYRASAEEMLRRKRNQRR